MSRVLVLNAGSSTLKWVVLEAESHAASDAGNISWSAAGGQHVDEFQATLRSIEGIDAVGHRVVHGGQRFREAIIIDAGVRDAIAGLADLAPLHNPAAVAGIDAAMRAFASVPHVAAFDTAFHAGLPAAAATYPLEWEWTQRWGLRRFGFHGLSVEYALAQATRMLGARPSRLIVCHLGAGCSATAVLDGRSVETSMGFTPLEGLMMVRRSGSIDPGLLLHLLELGITPKDLDRSLNERSGVRGVSGVSDDVREVLAAAQQGNERAELAIAMFCHRATGLIGALAAVLGGVDALVFTAGIGEHAASVRARIVQSLGFLGISLDPERNAAASGDADISASAARARTLVIAAREDLAILAAVRRLVKL